MLSGSVVVVRIGNTVKEYYNNIVIQLIKEYYNNIVIFLQLFLNMHALCDILIHLNISPTALD